MGYISKVDLRDEIKALRNSKLVMLRRLTSSPDSFAALDDNITEVVRDGISTSFVVGGDVMHVQIDAMGDRVTLTAIKRANQFAPLVVDLANDTPEVDFTPETAAMVFAHYDLLKNGPKPTGADLANALNAHVQ